jgi:methyltransferase (TIGR00027 family)
MSTTINEIENVSDTARWVAVYRAMETERPDAHFRDPWARRLAGEKGEAIVRAIPRGRGMAWAMIVRTAVFDRVILELVRQRGADMVVNLAAGLDTRPWRLELPPELRWVDVDLPGILAYKTSMMDGERPRCRYEAVHADLTDAAVRDALFARLGAEAKNALVVTEGLLVYLTAEDVASLAAALHAQAGFRWWLADLASPKLLEWMLKRWGKQAAGGNAPFRFAPAESTGFFAPFGWREERWFSAIEEAHALKREMRGMWFWRLLGRLSPKRRQEEWRRFSGFMLLERT